MATVAECVEKLVAAGQIIRKVSDRFTDGLHGRAKAVSSRSTVEIADIAAERARCNGRAIGDFSCSRRQP
jgi:hypothetical protein